MPRVTTAQIYDHLSLPFNLREHMLAVSAVGKILGQSLKAGVKNLVDLDLVVSTLLLHDLGNVLKIDFDQNHYLTPADLEQLEVYKKIQKKMRDLYGQTADEATLAILSELGVSQDIYQLCATSHAEDLPGFLHSDEWEKKICFYSDMRVGPHGLLLLDDRFADAKIRYSAVVEKINRTHMLARILEAQLKSVVDINLQTLDLAEVEKLKYELLEWQIEVEGLKYSIK